MLMRSLVLTGITVKDEKGPALEKPDLNSEEWSVPQANKTLFEPTAKLTSKFKSHMASFGFV